MCPTDPRSGADLVGQPSPILSQQATYGNEHSKKTNEKPRGTLTAYFVITGATGPPANHGLNCLLALSAAR